MLTKELLGRMYAALMDLRDAEDRLQACLQELEINEEPKHIDDDRDVIIDFDSRLVIQRGITGDYGTLPQPPERTGQGPVRKRGEQPDPTSGDDAMRESRAKRNKYPKG